MTEAVDQGSIAERTRRRWQWLRIVALLVGLGFMLWLAWKLLATPGATFDRVHWGGVAAAVCVGVFANAIIGLAFADLVGKLVPHVPYAQRMAAYYTSQVAKYVPGRVASLLVQRSILRGPGATTATVVSNLELAAVNAGLGCTMAGALILGFRSVPAALAVAASGIAMGTWLLRANWIPLLARFRMTRGLGDVRAPRIGAPRAASLAALMLVLPGASSFVLLSSGIGMAFADSVMLTALLMLSWVGGMLAFVFPVGLGIRELIFLALGGILPDPPSMELLGGVAIASRVVQMLIDVAGVGAFFAHRRWTATRAAE